jgi:hypothetical protein
VEHFSSATLEYRLLVLPVNIRLLWTNTIAYLACSEITELKSFITFVPGDNLIKTFILHDGNKLECFSLKKSFQPYLFLASVGLAAESNTLA